MGIRGFWGEVVFSRPRWLVRLASMQAARLLGVSTRLFAPVALAIAVSILAPTASADTIASNGSGGNGTSGNAFGQSVTTPGGGPWSDIIFNFYTSSSNPYANGSLYLLDHQYLGTPANLSSQTNLGVGTASGGTWTFDPSVTLQPGSTYWFYMDTASGSTVLSYSASDPYSGGNMYYSTGSSTFTNATSLDTVFLLQGTQVVPGPIPGAGLLSYLVVAIGWAAGFRKQLRARAAALFASLKLRLAELASLNPGALKRARARA